MTEEAGNELLLFEISVQKRISDFLTYTEVALANWDATKKKPKNMVREATVLRLSHQLLSGWLQKSLKGKKDGVSACGRLLEFSQICETLGRARSD